MSRQKMGWCKDVVRTFEEQEDRLTDAVGALAVDSLLRNRCDRKRPLDSEVETLHQVQGLLTEDFQPLKPLRLN